MSNTIAKNTLRSIFISLINFIYPVVSFMYVARILHPDGLGSVKFAAAFASYFVMITGLGMPIYGLRAVASSNRSELSRLTAGLFLIRGLTGVMSWIIFLIIVLIMRRPDINLFLLFGINILGAVPGCEWLYKGMQDYSILTVVSTISRLIGILALIAFVRSPSDIYVYASISVIMSLMISLTECIVADRRWELHITRNCLNIISSGRLMSVLREHLSSLMLFFSMTCAVTIYSQTDTVMLGFIKGNEAVGIYSCATKIKCILPMITGALWAAALPDSTARWKAEDTDGFRTLAGRSFHIVYTVIVPLVVYFFIFTDCCVIFIGGDEYMSAVLPMRILLLAVIPIGFSNIAGGQLLIPMGRERMLFYAEGIGAVSNIVMNAFLIPHMSVLGASISTTVSEVLVTVFAVYYVRRQIDIRVMDAVALRNTLTGCIVALPSALVLMADWPDLIKLFVSAAVFGSLYCIAMIILKDEVYKDMLNGLKGIYRRFIPEKLRRRIGSFRSRLRSDMYTVISSIFGSRFAYYCPCCNTKIRNFVSGNYMDHPDVFQYSRYVGLDQDVLCPVCGALPRHRILAAWCDGHRDIVKGRILYFALEKGMDKWFKHNEIECCSADLFKEADLRLDIEDTKQEDESWDCIFCNHVLEHVNDHRRALKELHRILKPGGYLICSFPVDDSYPTMIEDISAPAADRVEMFGYSDHVRVFGRDCEGMLVEAGFEVNRIEGSSFPDSIKPVIGPADYDVNYLFLCRK